MIKIDNFKHLNRFKIFYDNIYLVSLIDDIMKAIYFQSNDNYELFDLNEVADGNGPLYVCENKTDIENILNSIYKNEVTLTWCIKHTVTRINNKSFFQIGVIKERQYCAQYMIQIDDLDKHYLNEIERMITSSYTVNT